MSAGLTYTSLAVAFLIASIAAGQLAPRLGRGVLVLGGVIAMVGSAMADVNAWQVPALEPHQLIPALIILWAGQGQEIATMGVAGDPAAGVALRPLTDPETELTVYCISRADDTSPAVGACSNPHARHAEVGLQAGGVLSAHSISERPGNATRP